MHNVFHSYHLSKIIIDCRPVKEGGAGVHRIEHVNTAWFSRMRLTLVTGRGMQAGGGLRWRGSIVRIG